MIGAAFSCRIAVGHLVPARGLLVQLRTMPRCNAALFGDLTFVSRVQVEELAACMGHATDLRNAQFKACLVASEVVADQLAVPVAQEGSGMFAGTARTEIINDRLQIGELAGGLGPNISVMSFLRARRQHL